MASVQTVGVDALRAKIRGAMITPGDAGYDDARRIWNAMIDKRPAAIVRCISTADVIETVDFARESGMLLAVRGGGHNIAGSALCDGGIVVDLSQMKAIRVDAQRQRATVEGGATLAELDAATQAHGLVTPLGINSTTGVAGLTLGGGFGWTSRKFGLTCDNLLSAEVVSASGEVIHANRDDHADLFWALKGGSGNFGVVTRFEFQLHRLGPDVLSGLVVYPLSEAKSVLQKYRDMIATAPDEFCVWAVLRLAPPLPFLPKETHFKPMLALPLIYMGEPGKGERLVEPLLKFGSVLGHHVGVQPFVAWQQTFDPLLTSGCRNYWKSHNFSRLDDGLFDAAIEAVRKMPVPQSEIFIGAIGGAAARATPESAAYPHRNAVFVMNVHGRWETPEEDERGIQWARDFFAAAAPFATGGVYVNFMPADEGNRVRAAYGANYDRLAQIKRKYDPGNLFRTNQNIKPA